MVMSEHIVLIPDIGDFKQIPVISILVSPGAAVAEGDPLIELESDKATMEVPSPRAGTIAAIHVRVGDRISQGDRVLSLLGADIETTAGAEPAPALDATKQGAAIAS